MVDRRVDHEESTEEGKTISVMKGDITKDSVDAIVNAANGDLRHVGGLVAAILKAGGKMIQDERDDYVMGTSRRSDACHHRRNVTLQTSYPCLWI